MIKVWFNHWFSTSYGIIELIKKNDGEQVYVLASNRQTDSVIQNVCDEWYQDSLEEGEEYVQYCLDFCKKHNVDVFVPRRDMVEISQNMQRFHEIGVKVMVDEYEIVRILNDKAATYDLLCGCENIHIPDYYMVNTVEEFEKAYCKLKKHDEQICVKFVQDEGAMSYRRIAESSNKFNRLRSYSGAEITYDDYKNALKEVDRFDDLMVMPYLPGNEISVDCLDTQSGLIAIPRFKSSSRHEHIIYDEELLKMTQGIMDKVQLKFPCNIQFKIKDGIPYLLEINTRMSGGLQMACLAANINIPNIALNKLLGKDISWEQDKRERVVSYIEIPQIIR